MTTREELREAVARIIDPRAFEHEVGPSYDPGRYERARYLAAARADAILDRTAVVELVEALTPFAAMWLDLNEEVETALGVGGFVPTDDDIEVMAVKNGLLRRAHAALAKVKTPGAPQ